MELIYQYNELDRRGYTNILGIDLVNETAEQWDLLARVALRPTRLLAWIPKSKWTPVRNHGTLFLGVVAGPGIQGVDFRLARTKTLIETIYIDGWLRPMIIPVSLDSINDTIEMRVYTEADKFEVGWLLVSNPQHQKEIADLMIRPPE